MMLKECPETLVNKYKFKRYMILNDVIKLFLKKI